MSGTEWARQAMQFATSTLPNLLAELGEEGSRQVFARLQERYDEFLAVRNPQPGATIPDVSAEVAADRSEVDARLAERAGGKRKGRKRKPKGEQQDG